ncbi:thiamine phosphate synthase [Sphingomonas hankyongi]|uniref:Thiamine phosphate synthase n=1 Tax=Sphingomonas hankyongi TaxID=2908209 RepID=A0ABT0S5A9_9SPHN|nr:thiamine phosphate synthase [Sphingomonas hankyongi]MCL6730931.1 thiamine phosphate synthase [Sphingomonas hankyongi]
MMGRQMMMLPRLWLMTDERMGNRLWEAIERLPAGEAGIVFRHYATEKTVRGRLAAQVAECCRKRDLALGLGSDAALAHEVGADFIHNAPEPAGTLRLSKSVHSIEDAIRARAQRAALVFISPVFATRSHPGREPLGPDAAVAIAAAAGLPAIAMGGMNAQRFAPLQGAFHGWAGIDAWLED